MRFFFNIDKTFVACFTCKKNDIMMGLISKQRIY
jgi:hypothetical protein